MLESGKTGNNSGENAGMKQTTKTGKKIFVAHAHYTRLVDMQVSAFSKAEVEAIALRRMKLKGGIECMVDKIYSVEEEEELNKKLGDECGR